MERNRFLLVFTQGSVQTITNKIPILGEQKILPTMFGDLTYITPGDFPIFLKLIYVS